MSDGVVNTVVSVVTQRWITVREWLLNLDGAELPEIERRFGLGADDLVPDQLIVRVAERPPGAGPLTPGPGPEPPVAASAGAEPPVGAPAADPAVSLAESAADVPAGPAPGAEPATQPTRILTDRDLPTPALVAEVLDAALEGKYRADVSGLTNAFDRSLVVSDVHHAATVAEYRAALWKYRLDPAEAIRRTAAFGPLLRRLHRVWRPFDRLSISVEVHWPNGYEALTVRIRCPRDPGPGPVPRYNQRPFLPRPTKD